MYRIICERKHEHFTLKIDNQVVAHEHETRSRVNDKLVLPRYTKSKCQNALIFCGKKLWNASPNDIKQSTNLADIKLKLVSNHPYIKHVHHKILELLSCLNRQNI